MPRAVDVRVMPLLRLVLHVRGRDRDPALPLFRRVVDRPVVPHLDLRIVLRQHHRDRRRQRRLPVVHVPDRSHVHVRLRTLELRFGHLKGSCWRLATAFFTVRTRAPRRGGELRASGLLPEFLLPVPLICRRSREPWFPAPVLRQRLLSASGPPAWSRSGATRRHRVP